MHKSISAIALLALFYMPCLAVNISSEVPFTFEKGQVIIQAKIKREVPVDLILATGSKHSFTDLAMVQKYKLSGYYTSEGPVTGKNDLTYSFSPVPDIRVGSIELASLNMRYGSLSSISQAVGREIFGVLGADFFKGRVVQFDFERKVIRFLDKSESDELKKRRAGADPSKNILLSMAYIVDSIYPNITMPVVENVTFNGKKAKILLDTGTVTVIAFSSSSAKRVGLSTPPEKSGPRASKIDSLQFGTYEIKDVPVMLYAKGTSMDESLSEYGIVAGSIFLQNFIVTFDFNDKVVILDHI